MDESRRIQGALLPGNGKVSQADHPGQRVTKSGDFKTWFAT